MFETSVDRDGARTTVRVTGEVDTATAPSLTEGIHAALAGSPQELVVDFAEVSFINSRGLGAPQSISHRDWNQTVGQVKVSPIRAADPLNRT